MKTRGKIVICSICDTMQILDFRESECCFCGLETLYPALGNDDEGNIYDIEIQTRIEE